MWSMTCVCDGVGVAYRVSSPPPLQIEGCFPDTMTRCAELINDHIDVDFVDINSGCPIDLVYKKVCVCVCVCVCARACLCV